MKKTIKLKYGKLEINTLDDGKLILGELFEGESTLKELKIRLLEEGISTGLLETNIGLMEKGYRGQIPIAKVIEDEDAPIITNFLTNFELFLEQKDRFINGEEIEFDIVSNVRKGQTLIKIDEPPRKVLRYPDGRITILREMNIPDEFNPAGIGTIFNKNDNSVIAARDGLAHTNVYGVVSVHGFEEYRGIGEMHGEIEVDESLIIQNDVHNGARIHTQADLIVNGLIRAANIQTGGNVKSQFGIQAQPGQQEVNLIAGQSIQTNLIDRYNIWAGEHILVSNRIQRSRITCLDSLITPIIQSSEIRVGNTLIARQIDGNTQIFLGPNYVESSEISRRSSAHRQHIKKLEDFRQSIVGQFSEIEWVKEKTIQQIKKLRRLSVPSFKNDVSLKRFQDSLENHQVTLREKLREYKDVVRNLQREKLELVYFHDRLFNKFNPQVIVTGTIEVGAVIATPNQVLKIPRKMDGVRIKLNRIRGTLEVEELAHENVA